MSEHHYLPGTAHAQAIIDALDQFHRALTRRWREEACDAIVADEQFVRRITGDLPAFAGMLPSAFDGLVAPGGGPPLRWDPYSESARAHLGDGGLGCDYVRWVNGGQRGDLGAVVCDGSTTNSGHGVLRGMPDNVPCGMGTILEQIEDLAYVERNNILLRVPPFHRHDVAAIGAAQAALLRLGGQLGLEPSGGSTAGGSFTPVSDRDMSRVVEQIAPVHGDSQDWWAGWTGLAASRAGSGFFASVVPSVNNQSRIIGSLANLYSERASIIDKARRDALYWIRWATQSLDRTEVVARDVSGWVAVEGIGMGTAIAFGWSGAGAVVGATMALVGFLGQHVATHTEKFVAGMVEVVRRLEDEIGLLNQEIGTLENGYAMDVSRLRLLIHGVHSYNLELYDLTRNDADGDRDEDVDGDGQPRDPSSFSVTIGSVLRLAENCWLAGDRYAELLPAIGETRQADTHMAGQDGNPTDADRQLLEVRDLLGQFLQTTAGRYFVACDQVRAAAAGYVEVDTSQKEAFNAIMAEWERDEVGEIHVAFDPQDYAAATERPSWRPHLPYPEVPGGPALVAPGTGDGEDYVTDADRKEQGGG